MRTTIKTRRKRIPSWDELREMFQETDKKFQETDKKFQETDKKFQETDKKFQETDKQFKETDRKIQETAKQIQETGKQFQETKKIVQDLAIRFQETDKKFQETANQIKETDKKYRELADQFTSTTGHITEGLMVPEAVRIFQKAGFDIDRYYRNLKKKNKLNQTEMEVDLLMLNCTLTIAVEIKTDCRKKDIDHFLRQMPKFKKLFPEYYNKEVLAAVAAINYDTDAAKYAHEQGLLVISTTDGDKFTLEPCERKSLKRF